MPHLHVFARKNVFFFLLIILQLSLTIIGIWVYIENEIAIACLNASLFQTVEGMLCLHIAIVHCKVTLNNNC